MTACVNRKHTKKVAAVVTASLVGALSLGVAPVVAMAEDSGIELQFQSPSGAFENGKPVHAWFDQIGTGAALTPNADGVYEVEYSKDKPIVLTWFDVHFFGTAEGDTFKIDLTSGDYEVKYFARDAKGNKTGDELDDIYKVGSYVAEVTAIDGNYKGGVIYIPFDIKPFQLKNISVIDNTVTYDAEVHDFEFFIDNDGNGRYDDGDTKLYPGDDYDVEYVKTGHDVTNVKDVKDAGTYVAKITGKGAYDGTVQLSENIKVKKLDLGKAPIVGLTSSASEIEPKNLFAININGEWHTGDDPIMAELKADLADPDEIWSNNRAYSYNVTAVNPSAGNIINSGNFGSNKVKYELSFTYNGAALADSYEVIKNDPSTHWSASKLNGHADDTTVDGVDVKGTSMIEKAYDENGNTVSIDTVNSVAGKYTIVYTYVDGDNTVGGFAFVNITTYQEAVNADAKAAVIYNGKVVSSISKAYDGTDLLSGGALRVAVEDAAGRNVVDKCTVKYYNAEGKEVGKIVDAGTYTLKVTSSVYKLSGTTEMTITVGKLDLSEVRAGALKGRPFYETHSPAMYLPWVDGGYALSDTPRMPGLDLEYKDADGKWQPMPLDLVKATILDASGNEIDKIVDEGTYTVHFAPRFESAANNYVIPADITFDCIKAEHLLYADVNWNDYFADAVASVSAHHLMNGYGGTDLFGSHDDIKRGDVAVVLHNLATLWGVDMDEDSGHFTEDEGYKTGFDDVDGHMYYAQSILWAKQAGVINGDTGSNTFRPEEKVTRQEFAAMMANFASKYDKGYEAADADALDAVSDGAQVADWAKESVAWAVENGIMGNAGSVWPGQNIKRCDAAGMVFLYALDK